MTHRLDNLNIKYHTNFESIMITGTQIKQYKIAHIMKNVLVKFVKINLLVFVCITSRNGECLPLMHLLQMHILMFKTD